MQRAWFCVLAVLLMALVPGAAQTPRDLHEQIREFQSLLRSNDLGAAASAAAKLDDAIQARYRAFLTQDAGSAVATVLQWLPPNTESILVLQDPMVLTSPNQLIGKPHWLYATDRLIAVNKGEFYKRLSGRIVRLVVGGISNMHTRRGGVPGPMPDADAAYFYFFTEPVETELLGPSETAVEGHGVWRGTATIDSGEPPEPGVRKRTTREDETWFALVRPDVLVMASNRELLIDVLRRVASPEADHAFPDTLPEWAEVDRKALFWGLRHYPNGRSSVDETNPLHGTDNQPPDDAQAIGVTMQFYPDRETLEVHYLSEGGAFPLKAFRHTLKEFQVDSPRKGVSRMKANIRERGPFPLDLALHLLGFGFYQ